MWKLSNQSYLCESWSLVLCLLNTDWKLSCLKSNSISILSRENVLCEWGEKKMSASELMRTDLYDVNKSHSKCNYCNYIQVEIFER